MLRRSFGLLAALLFVLCLALATMWVREEPRLLAPPPAVPMPTMALLPRGVSPQMRRQLQLQAQYLQQRQYFARSSPPDVDLAKPMPRLASFKGSQVHDVLDWLCEVEAGPIEANWPAMEAAGIGPLTAVPQEPTPGGTFGSTLADVLTPMGLAFATDGHVVYVSTPTDIERFGHMRHVDRFAFTTQADSVTQAALGSDRDFLLRPRPLTRFQTDRQALRAAGIAFRLPTGSYTPTGMLLEQVLRDASARAPLRYQIRDGRVVISTAAALESADRVRIRVIAISMIGVLAAFCITLLLTRRRKGLRRFLCVALVLAAAFVICVPIWRARPDSISARIGRSRWTVGLGPRGSFILSKEPERLEEVFMSHRSNGPGRAVYCDRLGFYAAREGAPYQVFNAHAPRWAVIALVGALPLLWMVFNSTSVLTLPRRARERRRAGTGRCVRCGYNLHGCPSDRCPECGLKKNPPEVIRRV